MGFNIAYFWFFFKFFQSFYSRELREKKIVISSGFFEGHCQASISGRGEREGFCGRVSNLSPLLFFGEDFTDYPEGFNREAKGIEVKSKTYPGGDFKLKSEGQGPGMDFFGSPFPALAISWGVGHV